MTIPDAKRTSEPSGTQEPRFSGPRTISEQIADACGMMIVDGRYKAGQRMIEQQVAEQFGVSRGPVREAFRILQKRRLIDITPRKGTYVVPISLESIADLFNVRIALACLAARTMSERPQGNIFLDRLRERVEELEALAEDEAADPLVFAYAATRAVHAIARGSGNQLVIQMMTELNEQTVWTTIWKSPLDYVSPQSRHRRASELKTVLQNIQAGQGNAAEINLRLALEEGRDAALATLQGRVPGGG